MKFFARVRLQGLSCENGGCNSVPALAEYRRYILPIRAIDIYIYCNMVYGSEKTETTEESEEKERKREILTCRSRT